MCCCGCELALMLASFQAAEAPPAVLHAPATPRIGGRRDGATPFRLGMILRAVWWWPVDDTPLARLDRGSGQ